MGGCVSWIQRPSICCFRLYERPVGVVIYLAPYISLITLQQYVTYRFEGLHLVYRSQLHARSNQWTKLPSNVRSRHTCWGGCLRWAWCEKHETINQVDGEADERRHLFVCCSRTLLPLHVAIWISVVDGAVCVYLLFYLDSFFIPA